MYGLQLRSPHYVCPCKCAGIMLVGGPPDLVSPRDGEQVGFALSLRRITALCPWDKQATTVAQDVPLEGCRMHMRPSDISSKGASNKAS